MGEKNVLPKIGLAVSHIALEAGDWEGLGGFWFCFSDGSRSSAPTPSVFS